MILEYNIFDQSRNFTSGRLPSLTLSNAIALQMTRVSRSKFQRIAQEGPHDQNLLTMAVKLTDVLLFTLLFLDFFYPRAKILRAISNYALILVILFSLNRVSTPWKKYEKLNRNCQRFLLYLKKGIFMKFYWDTIFFFNLLLYCKPSFELYI